MARCCFCGGDATGSEFAIPEDFPRNKKHEGKPLCQECGGGKVPDLDSICYLLDRKLQLAKQRQAAKKGGG